MKNVFKVLGIIALAAVIGFSMVSCGGDDDSGGGGSAVWPEELTSGSSSISGSYMYDRGYWRNSSNIGLTFTTIVGPSSKSSNFDYTGADEYVTFRLVSVGSGSFTVKDFVGGTSYTVKYSLSGNTLTVSDFGGIPGLTAGAYTKVTN